MKTNGQSKIESGDSAVAIYHVVYAHEGFEESAQILFKLIQEAQQKRPGMKRKGVTLILTPIIANCVSARHCRES